MGELGPKREVLVGVRLVCPLILTGNRPDLPLVPAVDVRPLEVATGGLIRGLSLAWIGNKHDLCPVVTTEEYKPLPMLTCRGGVSPSTSVGPLSST